MHTLVHSFRVHNSAPWSRRCISIGGDESHSLPELPKSSRTSGNRQTPMFLESFSFEKAMHINPVQSLALQQRFRPTGPSLSLKDGNAENAPKVWRDTRGRLIDSIDQNHELNQWIESINRSDESNQRLGSTSRENTGFLTNQKVTTWKLAPSKPSKAGRARGPPLYMQRHKTERRTTHPGTERADPSTASEAPLPLHIQRYLHWIEASGSGLCVRVLCWVRHCLGSLRFFGKWLGQPAKAS